MSSRLDKEISSSLRESVRGWSERHLLPSAADRDQRCYFDESLYHQLDTELGIMNMTLPETLGGTDLNIDATLIAIECLSEIDPGMAISYLSQELLFSHQLYQTWKHSNQDIPDRHAAILKQKALSGMAMTEPDAGTDVLGMRTTATQADDGFILNGVKQWITNGTIGKYFLVYARTGEQRRDISLFLVDAETPGLTRTSCGEKMGMRSSPTGILTFQNCKIPQDSCVGRYHEGLRPMLRNLGAERLGLAAQSVGIANTCMRIMREYAGSRRAFDHPIANFGQIQSMLAMGYAKLKAMKCLLHDTTQAYIDQLPDASMDADATKLFCAIGGEEISRMAIQVLGANGYSAAYPVERLHRDAILLSIGGGTNEALEKNITRLLMK